MFNTVRVIIMVTVLICLLVFVYFCIYSKNINKKIASGKTDGKRMIDTSKIVMAAIIVLLFFYSIIISHDLKSQVQLNQVENRNSFVEIDLDDYTCSTFGGSNEDASFAKIYSKDENVGYKKTVQKDGNFTFTVFTRESKADSFHPDFICFVDYNGESKGDMAAEIDFQKGNSKTGGRYGGASHRNSLLYIGNLNAETTCQISLEYEDSAEEQGSVTIGIE